MHRETPSNEIKISEAAVQRTLSAIDDFMNPWTVEDKDQLCVLSSGSKEVEYDIPKSVTDELGSKAK